MAENSTVSNTQEETKTEDEERKLDPAYYALSKINGRINRMKVRELKQRLNELGLYNRGVPEVLRRRLKNYYKVEKLACEEVECQYYPRLVVVDFEATCEEENPDDYVHEIIEFPAVLIDTTTCSIIEEFHSYCRPILNPTLSNFCTQLTGITQAQVDAAPAFKTALTKFEKWLKKNGLLEKGQCAFVTDGCWDFCKFLNVQCSFSNVYYPRWAGEWINLKKSYGNFYKLKKPRILDMLSNIGLEFEGHLHCGADDARNLARIVIRMIQDGAKLQLNERLYGGQLRYIDAGERLMIADKQLRLLGMKPPSSKEVDDVVSELETLELRTNK